MSMIVILKNLKRISISKKVEKSVPSYFESITNVGCRLGAPSFVDRKIEIKDTQTQVQYNQHMNTIPK